MTDALTDEPSWTSTEQATIEAAEPAEPQEPVLSGIDLARVALYAAREAAHKNGTTPGKRTKRSTPVAAASRARGGDREPQGLAGALQRLIAERAWDLPVAGGTVVDAWPRIAPDLADHVTAVGYDPDSGTLDLRPTSPAWATRLRLGSAELLRRIEAHTGNQAVRALRILTPGHTAQQTRRDEPSAAAPLPAPPSDPSPGFQRAKAAHHATHREQQEAPLPVREALARQSAALAANREPEEAFAEARYAAEQLQQRQTRGGDVHAAALRRAHRERAERQLSAITAIQSSAGAPVAPLRRTA
ncbi:DciA family protein [Streptacidiphilus neutrinimicus]|uniref:DciA family protein n=1 Tax=Streptacidiphilus neutrinimicus TaxID=105420 RepID=UPI0005A88166|nr:DciA family protein [Streptacidiphilus neutrinimicus]